MIRPLRALLPHLLGLALGTGCGRSEPPPPPDPEAARPTTVDAPSSPAEGRVEGAARAPAGAGDARIPDVAVDGCPPGGGPEGALRRTDDGALADVLVRFAPPAQSASRPPAAPPAEGAAVLAVEGCVLAPRALVARKGQALRLENRDDRYHALGLSRLDGGAARRIQTLPLAPKEAGVVYTLEEPGFYRIASDQLTWTRGLLLVLDADERGVATGPDGAFSTVLPAAPWDVTARHETLGEATSTVEVSPGETASLYVTPGSPGSQE